MIPKSETRNPRSERNPKTTRKSQWWDCSDFGLRTSFGLRMSDFGFRRQVTFQQALTTSMRSRVTFLRICCAALVVAFGAGRSAAADKEPAERNLLYVATPGIRDYLEYGGHGILVFDINAGHKFVKRIPSAGLDDKGRPLNVKGIAACAQTHRLYLTTTRTLLCFDLVSEKLVWEKAYE